MATLGSSNGNGKQSFCATSFKLALQWGMNATKGFRSIGELQPIGARADGQSWHKSSNSLLTGCCIHTLEQL